MCMSSTSKALLTLVRSSDNNKADNNSIREIIVPPTGATQVFAATN